MHSKIAKITSTSLGYEDHGIFTAQVMVTYGGSGQGIGGYCLDEPYSDAEGKFKGRRGTAYGMEWIIRFMRACGVDTWERVNGRTILVYTKDDSWGALPIGVGPLPTEPGELFLYDDLKVEERV